MNLSVKENRSQGSIALWGVLLLVVLGIVVLGAMAKMKKQGEQGEQPEKAVPVRVQVLEARSVTDVITIPGKTAPIQSARIPAERGGKVVEVLVAKGDQVEKGQVLAKLDDRLWVAQREQALVEKREAERDVRRWQELKKTGAVATRDVEATQARLDMANAALDAARVMISQCEARSPFAGTVDDQYAELGEYVPEGGLLFSLVDTTRIEVRASIPERDILAVGVGQDVVCDIAACDGSVTGKVSFVSAHADPMSNAFRIEVVAPNAGGRIRAGMIAKLHVVRGTLEGVSVVSLSTIVPQRGDHVVFVAREGRAERRIVKIDRILGHEAVIASGIVPGDRVIITGHRALQDGALIQVEAE